MKVVTLAGLAFLLVGCNSSGSDEAEAAKALAPKPPTAEQKAQLDKVRSQFPQNSGGLPGH